MAATPRLTPIALRPLILNEKGAHSSMEVRIQLFSKWRQSIVGDDLLGRWVSALALLDGVCLRQEIAFLLGPNQELDGDEGLLESGHIVSIALKGEIERLLIDNHGRGLLLGDKVVGLKLHFFKEIRYF